MTLKIEIPDLTPAQSIGVLDAVSDKLDDICPLDKRPEWTYSFEDEPIEIPVKESTPFSRYMGAAPSTTGTPYTIPEGSKT